jgi:NAD(P)-dependent dehydrogenase (short-subunit alcohol dehydrogenase family)
VNYPDSNTVPDFRAFSRLDGRGFVLLGAGDGIGRQTAHALSQCGASVLCVDRIPRLAEEVASEIGGTFIEADVTLRADMERVVAAARGQFGRSFEGVVDIVGVATTAPLMELDDAAWQRQFDIVLRHAYLTIQLAGSALAERGGGSLTFVGSISGAVSVVNQAAYGTAKAALHHLVRCAAHELGSVNVRVNAVAPGFVRTPRLLKALSSEFWERVSRANPLQRVAIPADIAAVLLFLVSDMARYVTANILTLDGGVSTIAALPDFSIPRSRIG